MISLRLSIALLASAVPVAPTLAQNTPAPAPTPAAPAPATAADAHHDHDNDIIVTGTRRNARDVLGGVSVLDAADLSREIRASIGETLARQPGVTASSFGPTASRPILRGLSGDRVRILTDGIGSLDVSSSSADHAVAINPLTAERIEVLRGPSALLFGSSAIGGVVNVIDARIPRRVPDGVAGGDVLLTYGTAAHERSANLGLDLALGGNFVAHADGNWSDSEDLRTGGYLLSHDLREEAAASPFAEVRELARLKGRLPNTEADSSEVAGGLAYIDGGLNIGASITRHTATYGVPIRFSLDPAVEAEAPTIDVKQTRGDARAEIPLSGMFSQIRLRGGIAKYRHDELEDTGEIGSSFFSRGGEGRAELVQAERGGWGGTSGVQYLKRSVRIEGEEKFLPDSRQTQLGLFTMQSLVKGPLRIEGGVRVELSRLNADADDQLDTPQRSRRFTTFSASGGATYQFSPSWRGGLTLSSSARAPSLDELFANGPHAGTQAFEIGDPDLDPERSLSIEASARHTSGPLRVTATAYHSRFSNFIFQAPTGEIEDDLPVYSYRQGSARYTGFEVEADAKLGRALGIAWSGEVIADAVRATIKGFGPAPQIPPLRLLGALTGEVGQFDGRFEVEHAFAQKRTATLETDTPGYTLVGASIDWHPLAKRPELSVSLSANNLFDVVARRHSSLLKDYAPLAGRDVRLSARLGF
ncbi:TonB-dependent receptor domain-containing protein [Sphingomonas sp.]|uniref:TonB-dependent receptor n=1 Tax=Sphingomonas sp. TaxID=28214 RepID=UPI00286D77EE|nr:TonB-dependent receptor [Sphingomonas sp.]